MKPSAALLVIFPLILISAAFVLMAYRGAGAGATTDGTYWDEQVVRFIRQRVANSYVDELDEARAARAFYAALDAYVHELDIYCDFIPPDEHRQWRENTSGKYAGLGIKVREADEGILVVGVLPDGPAGHAGLLRGETIVAVNGASLVGKTLPEIEQSGLLKGEPGSRATLRVLPGRRTVDGPPVGPERDVVVIRDVIRPPTVFPRRAGPEGRVGVIRLREFATATKDAFNVALDDLIEAGVEGIVLDLRGNGGGVLPAAVAVADRFLSRGVIVRMEGRSSSANRSYEADPDNAVSDALPLVVLVDRRSASASEVVAGALQDHRRALLVGGRTYGKFLVQSITDIPGYEAAVQITTSRYYLPSGRSYQRTNRNGHAGSSADGGAAGIMPDVLVSLGEEDQATFDRFRVNEEARPWGEAVPFPDVSEAWVDPQLAKAMELLEGQLILRRIRGTASDE